MFSENLSIAITVSDGKRSAKWFRDVIGLEVSEQGHWITAHVKGAEWKIHLCESDQLEPGNTGVAFWVDDVKKSVEELKKKGVKFSRDYTKNQWGESAIFDDPDGNAFWLKPGSP